MNKIKQFVNRVVESVRLKAPPTESFTKARGEHVTSTWNTYPYNPDELIVKKGYDTIDKMRTDDQVRAVMAMKVFARLAPGWDVAPATNAKSDVDAANFCRWNLENLPGTWENRLLQIMSALTYGFSVAEINWELQKEGGHQYNGKIILRSLRFRRPHYMLFYQDEYGDLEEEGIGQEQRDGTVERFPTEKFLRYSYQEEFDNPYGLTDYRNFYREWWIKTVVLKFYAMYLERFPFPPTIGLYNPGLPETEVDALAEVLERLQVATTAVLPDTLSIDQLEVPSTGAEIFKEAIEIMNKGITRSALVPDLLGFTNTGTTGSYALGKKHFDVFLWILTELGKDISAVVTEQLLSKLSGFNFDAAVPKFIMRPPEDDIVARSKVLDVLLRNQAIDPKEEWVRDYMNVPKEGEPYQGRFSMPSSTTYSERSQSEGMPIARSEEQPIIESFPYRALTATERNSGIDYGKHRRGLDSWIYELTRTVSSELYTEIKNILPTVKGIFAGKNLQAARNLKFNISSIRNGMVTIFLKVYLEGKIDGLEEIEKSLSKRISFGEKLTFQDAPKPEELIRAFRGRIPMTKDEWRKLLTRMRSRAFTVAGQVQKDIVSDIQELIYKAIRDDWTMDELMSEVERKGISYTGKAWQHPPATPMKPWHTELVFRNAISSIYNESRKELFNNPNVAKYVPALQYSAILDSRTRDTHRAMDGRIYKRTDPIWKEWFPPNGHNCRCLTIPVTSNLEYNVSSPTALEPDEGFGRGK